jgi:hypothetical protein
MLGGDLMYGVKTFYSLKGCVDYANRNDYEIITIIPKKLRKSVHYLDVDEFEMVYKKEIKERY